MNTILEIEHLNKQFGSHIVLPDLSFNVGEQEIVGFLGPNGSGKSTTLKCVTGLYHPTGGQVRIGGYSVEKQRKQALSLIGQSIEHPTLYPELSGRDHLKMMAHWRGVSKERVKEMEEFSGLGANLKKAAGNYSMGMKMRLMLSIALLHHPKLLILDEPTNGLDPDAVFQLREEMKQIRNEGSSILFSSHQLGEVEKVVDRVILIRQGEKLYDGELPENLQKNVQYQLLLSDKEKAEKLAEEQKQISLLFADGETNTAAVSTAASVADASRWLNFTAASEEALSCYMKTLVENDIQIRDFRQEKKDLESFYREHYKQEEKDGGI